METFTRKNIDLPRGGTLEVDVTPQFLEILKKHFNFSKHEEITDDHIRMFIWGSLNNAIEKSVLGN